MKRLALAVGLMAPVLGACGYQASYTCSEMEQQHRSRSGVCGPDDDCVTVLCISDWADRYSTAEVADCNYAPAGNVDYTVVPRQLVSDFGAEHCPASDQNVHWQQLNVDKSTCNGSNSVVPDVVVDCQMDYWE